ncbi:protein transport protein Sec61 subunit gamma [Drosophila ficusphila]|uniref:protein transport protein Sec61 subunit gamma n=1 Tax=Drosophila ficusphila TaxID=30025 RepID=UPI0007E7A226|nr:protein transport protein Sec61 subunit gamma [Drosophila ficusphila]
MEQLLSRRRKYRQKSSKRGLRKLLPSFNCKSLESVSRQVRDQLCLVLPSGSFYKNSKRFYKRCTKPDRQEFQRISAAIGVGFLIMGSIGFVVKLMHIPIVNIIMD